MSLHKASARSRGLTGRRLTLAPFGTLHVDWDDLGAQGSFGALYFVPSKSSPFVCRNVGPDSRIMDLMLLYIGEIPFPGNVFALVTQAKVSGAFDALGPWRLRRAAGEPAGLGLSEGR